MRLTRAKFRNPSLFRLGYLGIVIDGKLFDKRVNSTCSLGKERSREYRTPRWPGINKGLRELLVMFELYQGLNGVPVLNPFVSRYHFLSSNRQANENLGDALDEKALSRPRRNFRR